MRPIRLFLVLSFLGAIVACSQDVIAPGDRPALSSGYMGTGNRTDSTTVAGSTAPLDSTTDSSGYMGTGN